MKAKKTRDSVGALRWVAVASVAMTGNAVAQNLTPIEVLTRAVTSESQRSVAVAIGVLCPPGNRVSAQLQADCNALVGGAFRGETGVSSALAQIVPDNVNASFDRSQAQTGSRVPGRGRLGAMGPGFGFVESEGNQALSFLPDLSGGAYAATSDFGQWSVFAHLDFADYSRDASSNEDGFDADRHALTFGVGRRFSDHFDAGIGLGFGRDDLDFTGGSGGQDIDTQRLLAYASWSGDSGWYVDGLASWQRRETDQVRRVAYALSGGTVVDQNFSADYDGDVSSFSVAIGRHWQHESMGIDPYLGFEYSTIDVDGYTEVASTPGAAGAGWAIVSPELESDVTVADLGVRLNWAISGANGVWLPQIDLAYVTVLNEDEDSTSVRFEGDISPVRALAIQRFAIINDEEDDSYARLGLGVVAQWSGGRSGFFNIGRYFAADRYDLTELTLGMRWEF